MRLYNMGDGLIDHNIKFVWMFANDMLIGGI